MTPKDVYKAFSDLFPDKAEKIRKFIPIRKAKNAIAIQLEDASVYAFHYSGKDDWELYSGDSSMLSKLSTVNKKQEV